MSDRPKGRHELSWKEGSIRYRLMSEEDRTTLSTKAAEIVDQARERFEILRASLSIGSTDVAIDTKKQSATTNGCRRA